MQHSNLDISFIKPEVKMSIWTWDTTQRLEIMLSSARVETEMKYLENIEEEVAKYEESK